MQKRENDNVHIISYSSRSLTTTEQKYSQIEREYLSLDYACKRHHIYVFGGKFKMCCDNKAFVNLLKRSSSKLPLRIEKMLYQLQGYEFAIEYMKSESNIWGFISRHPIQDKRQIDENTFEKYASFVKRTTVTKSLTTDDNSTATKQDKFLQNLRQRIENNDWNLLEKLNFDNETFNLLKRYRKFKDALTINLGNDIILKDNRIILPEIFHKTLVKLAHIGHQGIQKTKALMRSKVFFLGMDNAIENECYRVPCQATGRSNPQSVVQPTKIPK